MNSTELKEAIAEYIKSKELVLMGYSPEYIDDVKTDMEIAFRAGAEWMAEQEQPEVGLDREIIKYKVPFTDEREYLNETTLDAIAQHFYNLAIADVREEVIRLNNTNKQIAKEKKEGASKWQEGVSAGYADVISFINNLTK